MLHPARSFESILNAGQTTRLSMGAMLTSEGRNRAYEQSMVLIDKAGMEGAKRLPERSADDWRDRMLLELETHVRRMNLAYKTRPAFWLWFEGEADSLLRGATVDEQRLLRQRVESLLARARIVDRYPP